MRKLIKNLYYNTIFGYCLISIPKYLYDFYRYRLFSDEVCIKKTFKRIFGYELNLANPRSLNEKIQWLKLNDRTNLHTICADKLSVRDYVKDKIGEKHLIPLVYSTSNVKELTLEKLPEYPVIIKTNHGSGNVIVVKDKRTLDIKNIQNQLKKHMEQNYYVKSKEWQYKNIRPKILVEKLLIDEHGKVPPDYKFHCFHGRVEMIHVDIDRFIDHRRNFYDREWKLLPFICAYESIDANQSVSKPEMLKNMIGIAERLSSPFYYVRIDLYLLDNEIYFGEITFHHESGFKKFNPAKFDMILGEKLRLPIEKSES